MLFEALGDLFEAVLFIFGQCFTFRLFVDSREKDNVVLREIQVNDPRAATLAYAAESHPSFAKSTCALYDIASFRVFYEFRLKSPIVLIIYERGHNRCKARMFNNSKTLYTILRIIFQGFSAILGSVHEMENKA